LLVGRPDDGLLFGNRTGNGRATVGPQYLSRARSAHFSPRIGDHIARPSLEWSLSVLDDVTSVTLHTALSALTLRQRVTANNIANIETPNFHAGKVSFENVLNEALANGDSPADVTPTVRTSLEPTREDGNNVNLDEETISSYDTQLRYETSLRALDNKFGLLKDVIKDGA
jgi:flagellar basal-body rod protein FlgB